MSSRSFPKSERLCSHRLIDQLYAEGHRLMAFPYSVQWMEAKDLSESCQVMIVAPKRKFKHAVDRNRVRRLTRECWRKQKDSFCDSLREFDCSIVFSLVYVHNEIMPFAQLEHKMDKLLTALLQDIKSMQL